MYYVNVHELTCNTEQRKCQTSNLHHYPPHLHDNAAYNPSEGTWNIWLGSAAVSSYGNENKHVGP